MVYLFGRDPNVCEFESHRSHQFIGGCYVIAKRNKGQLKTSVGGISKKFIRISELYWQFAEGWTGLDFSDQALIDMFNNESYGSPVNTKTNGFYIGKQWMGVSISMWKEDLAKGYLTTRDLYDDPRFPVWWLDRVLRD